MRSVTSATAAAPSASWVSGLPPPYPGGYGTRDVPGYFPRIPAHQPNNPVVSNGSPYTFRAKDVLSTRTELVRVSVAGWDTDLDHVMVHHSRADEAAHGGHTAKVFPK